MSTRDAGAVIIRLDLRGQEELKRRLEELGPAGKRLGRELESAMKPVAQQGKLAKASLDEVSGAIRDATREAGPFGRVLGGLGPIGMAAAAALGVLAMAVREVFVQMRRSAETAAYASRLEDVSRAAGVAMTDVQNLGTTVELAGGSFEAGTQAMEQWAIRLGRVRALGQGETFDALRVLGISRADLDGMNAAEALDVVVARLMEIDDISSRLALADRLGLSGMSELLRRSASDARELAVEAERINAGLSEALLQRLAAANDQMDRLRARQGRAEQITSAAFIELELRRLEAQVMLEERKAAIANRRLPIEERTTDQLELQRQLAREALETSQRYLDNAPVRTTSVIEAENNIRRQLELLEQLNAEQERRERIESRQALGAHLDGDAMRGSAAGFLRPEPPPAASPEMTLQRRRELESLVAQSLREIMTPLQRVARLEADLNEARAAGIEVTDAQVAAILARAQAEVRSHQRSLEAGRRQIELAAARLEGDLERVRVLEEEAALAARIAAYESQGLNLTQARQQAAQDMARLAQAREHAEERSLQAMQHALDLLIAGMAEDTARVRTLEDEAALRARTLAYQQAGLDLDRARARAAQDIARIAQERARADDRNLGLLRDAHRLEIARLRGDDARVKLLQRQAAIQAEIRELTAAGMDPRTARDVAETRANERALAARVGEVRDMVEQGFRSGLQAFVQTGDMAALGRGMAVSFVEYAAGGLIESLSSQAADWLLGGFDAAAEGAAQGSAAAVPMSAAITTSGATAATAMGTAITTAGSAVAAQMAAAMAGGQGASVLGDIVKGVALPGLDSGGTIRINGRSGIDNNVLSINNRPVARVSADETISINPRLGGQGGGPVIVQRFVLDARNAVMTAELLAELQEKANESARAEAAQVAADISGETVRRSRATLPAALDQQRALSG